LHFASLALRVAVAGEKCGLALSRTALSSATPCRL
jgi:hypothetical protein